MKTPFPKKDFIQRFMFEHKNVRGEIVCLNKSYATILEQHAYPKPIRFLLGQTLIAAVALTNSLKFKGQLTIQFTSHGPIKLLVAKCSDQFHIRGLAQWQVDATQDELAKGMQDGDVVVTIQPDDSVKPYQSIVPLQGLSLKEALEHYFNQSEQIPTRFFGSVDSKLAAGVLLQLMPSTESERESTLKFWNETIEIFEKIDPKTIKDIVNKKSTLISLFPSEEIRVFDPNPVIFQCTCSIPRMEDALRTVGKVEADKLLDKKQIIVITCEFCNTEYDFGREDVERIFRMH